MITIKLNATFKIPSRLEMVIPIDFDRGWMDAAVAAIITCVIAVICNSINNN